MKIRYLATIITGLKALCKFLPLANNTVRPHVPPENLDAYDAGVDAVFAFCDLLLAIDWHPE